MTYPSRRSIATAFQPTASFPARQPSVGLSLTPHPRPLPQRVPPSAPPSFRSRCPARSPHLAWLSGHPTRDTVVLQAANRASTYILRVHGTATDVLALTRITGATHVHAHVLHPLVAPSFPFLQSNGVILCLAGNASSSASEPPSVLRTDPLVPAFAVALAGPALVESRGDSIKRYSLNGGSGDVLEEADEPDERTVWERLVAWLTHVYLPQGFPHTTTPDYISFTKYRTLQNLASAIMSVISTEALLFGLGLGKQVAAGAAATSWVLKDGASYLVKIGYGSVFGSKFDDDPKSWRIAADIVEDIGGAIEILTPLFPLVYFLPLASLAVCLRGMSLMTGTATRHVVYRSLAASGIQNTGDIATKGESQGVTMKMLGLGTGILVSSRIGQNYYALLAAYSALAAVHIIANWRSVQCVQFSFFNKQRASILIESHLKGEQLPNPYDVSHSERIVLPPWRGFEPAVKIGVKVTDAVSSSKQLQDAVKLFKGERFLIFTHSEGKKVRVLLRPNATSKDALRAYYTIKKYLVSNNLSPDKLADSYHFMKRNIKSFERKAGEAGWDTRHMLLTDGRTRVSW